MSFVIETERVHLFSPTLFEDIESSSHGTVVTEPRKNAPVQVHGPCLKGIAILILPVMSSNVCF